MVVRVVVQIVVMIVNIQVVRVDMVVWVQMFGYI